MPKFKKGHNRGITIKELYGNKKAKEIIEIFGDYWHKNTQKKDKKRLKTYSKYGYKTLVIWEHELKNPIQVLNKIKQFVIN